MAVPYHLIDASNTDARSVRAEPELGDAISFKRGQPIRARLPNPLVFEVDYASRDAVPHFVGITIPVFSTRLVETLRAAGVENFEVFPAVLRNAASGEEWDGYWALNVIGVIAAADVDRSRADTLIGADPKGVAIPLLAFHELVLDEKKTRNVAMFRLAESPGMLLIHDLVLGHIRKHRPDSGWGIDVTEIETV